MKKLEQKDFLLSPKVVTDLTGSGESSGVVSDKCPETYPNCYTSALPGGCQSKKLQCLSEDDNPCASEDNCTGEPCLLTGDNTCLCTKVCPKTQSDNNICCEASEDTITKCCITPPISVDNCIETSDCQETDDCPETYYHCYYTDNCQETEGCQVTNSIQYC